MHQACLWVSLANCSHSLSINSTLILFLRPSVGCAVVSSLCLGGSLGPCWVGVPLSHAGGWKNVSTASVLWLSSAVRSDLPVCGARTEVHRAGPGIPPCSVSFHHSVLLSPFSTPRPAQAAGRADVLRGSRRETQCDREFLTSSEGKAELGKGIWRPGGRTSCRIKIVLTEKGALERRLTGTRTDTQWPPKTSTSESRNLEMAM